MVMAGDIRRQIYDCLRSPIMADIMSEQKQ